MILKILLLHDFWGLGLVVYELLCGFPPLSSLSDKSLDEQKKASSYFFPIWVSDQAKSFVYSLLGKDEHFIIDSVDKAKEHPFLEGTDWKGLLNMTKDPPFVPDAFSTSNLPLSVDEQYFDSLLFLEKDSILYQ